VRNDVAAQVQDGQVQQLFLNQVEDVDDAAGTPVAVGERVDGLELVVAAVDPTLRSQSAKWI